MTLQPEIALAHLMRRGYPAAQTGPSMWRATAGATEVAVHTPGTCARAGHVYARCRGDWLMVTSIVELDGWIAGGVT